MCISLWNVFCACLQRRRPDPFKLPKAAEKTGFSASQIKVCKYKT